MEKPTLNVIASAVIIFRELNPAWVFLESKPANYHIVSFRNHLCPFGGDWGRNTRGRMDRNPKETVAREINEELSLERSLRHPLMTPSDIPALADIRDEILQNLTPFGDFFQIIPAKILQKSDPEARAQDRAAIISYWTSGITEDCWARLVYLQNKFGNVCTEGTSMVISLGQILAAKIPFSWGSDQVMREFFWFRHGFNAAERLPLFPEISMRRMGWASHETYREYLNKYNFLQLR